ncbi:guanylate cyclase domain-containing protein, partial [Haematococcus lacustris]
MHCSPDVDRALRGYARQARLADEANKTRGGVHLSTRDVMRLATWHEEVTLLFADIKGFTSMAAALHPAQVMLFLNHLFNQFDDLLADHDVYKVETVRLNPSCGVLLGKDPVVEQADVATSPLYTSLRLALSQQQLETCPATEATCN